MRKKLKKFSTTKIGEKNVYENDES